MSKRKNTIMIGTVAAALAVASAVYAGRTKYTAQCNTPHGLSGSWWGPDRDNKKDADDDAEAHRKAYPNHKPEIFERPE
jgi:hypothetical protein